MDDFYTQKDDYKKDMGIRMRKCRTNSNLTQAKTADILNTTAKHYGEAERGVVGLSVNKLLCFSNFFDVSIDYLLKGKTDTTALPFLLINMSESCPDEKKGSLLELLKCIDKLVNFDR